MTLSFVRVRQAPLAGRCIGLASAVAIVTTTAHAQTVLDPVVITATRAAQPLALLSADVVLIDSARIRASSATTLEDLLQQQAGLQLSRNGAPGQSASVLIRGAGASSTVVLIDGVRVGSATLGQTALESISLAQIDRIEILRGPASSLYGADAVGGVVQVFTRRGAATSRLDARVAAGGYGSRQAELSASGGGERFDYAIGLSHERSAGVSALRPNDVFGNYNPDRDGFRRNAWQVSGGFRPLSGHRLGVTAMQTDNNAQYDASEFAPPTFAQDPSPDFRSRVRARLYAIDYQAQLGPAWNSSLKLARHEDDSLAGGNVVDRFRTRRNQATWQNVLDLATGQEVVVALERLVETVDGTPFVNALERSNNAVVVGYSGRFGRQSLQADLRHDDNSIHGGVTTGRVGYSLAFAEGWRARALAGTSFRAPTFNDLFYPGYGVVTIEPERGRSVELGLNWSHQRSQAAFTVYRNRVSKLIAYEPDRSFCPPAPAYDFGCARNINEAVLKGANLTAAHAVGAWTVRASLDWLDATDARTGVRLNRRAAHQESLSVDHGLGGPLELGATVLVLGARPDGGAQLASETTVDLRARWRVAPHWQLEAKLLNAGDRDLQPVRDYQGLGRQAWIGLRYAGEGL